MVSKSIVTGTYRHRGFILPISLRMWRSITAGMRCTGRKVRQLYAERRSGREVAIVEAEPGVAIVLAAWMLDPAICATMSLGPPRVDIAALADLDRLLRALGLRRACSAEPPPSEEVHHAIAAAS